LVAGPDGNIWFTLLNAPGIFGYSMMGLGVDAQRIRYS
jgi:hypothetical protein